MNANKKYKNVELKPYSVIKITARKVSDRVQPEVRVGEKYAVVATDRLAGGCPVAVVQHPFRKGKTMRINADRFGWEKYTVEMANEEKFHEEVRENFNKLLHAFTFEEHMKIAFIPHVILYCAWDYTEMTLNEAVFAKISETKKLSRAVRMLHNEYEKEIAKDLDTKHRKELDTQGEMFRVKYGKDMERLENAIELKVRAVAPDDPYIYLRVYAFVGMLLIDYYVRHTKECDKMIEERLGNQRETILNPKIMALRECLDAYTGNIEIDLHEGIDGYMDIIEKRINSIEFKLGEPINMNKLNEAAFLSKQKNAEH